MFRSTRILTLAAACVATAALTVPMAPSASAADAGPGEPGIPQTELLGEHGPVVPLKNQAQIAVSKWGIRYQAGQQDSRLTITEVDGKLLYVDTATESWRTLPSNCVRRAVPRGISALCSIPAKFQDTQIFLEVWPRLGNDHVDASSISDRYRMWVLADAGKDRVVTGDGDDFINGAQNRDRVSGGAGDDWIRAGKANDVASGGDGDDYIVGQDSDDLIYGGAGDDRLYGAGGADTLWPEDGVDFVVGGGGPDHVYADGSDKVVQCESVTRVS